MATRKTPQKSATEKIREARARARAAGREVETQATEIAYKIWLAGVGAYGKAYDTAVAGAQILNKQSADTFEELVRRGAEIESDVRARLAADERISLATGRLKKAVETARGLQDLARDRFEARMERMRDLLGVRGLGDVRERLGRRIDRLEDDVASATARARAKVGDADVRARLARLTAEIEAVASEAGADVAKTAKKAVRKATKAVRSAVAPIEGADDLTQIKGLGPALAAKLAAEGITRFSQIAAMSKAEIEALDARIGARGRAVKAGWVKQAKAFAGV